MIPSAAAWSEKISDAPPGARYESISGGFVAEATTRSWIALYLVPFMIIWSSISLGSIYGLQFKHGFAPGLSMLGIPFLCGAVWIGSLAMMSMFGHVTVRREGNDGFLFEGIGPVGWTRRFQWPELERVSEVERQRGSTLIALTFKAGSRSRLRFGSTLSEARRLFLLSVLRSQIKR